MSTITLTKSHRTALCIVPPRAVWEPIQAIRCEHDPEAQRWMPHIRICFPFVFPEEFDEAEARLKPVTDELPPFTLSLRTFQHFVHPNKKATVWLTPEPAGPLAALHRRVEALYPSLDKQERYGQGFVPHLTVGRCRTGRQASYLQETLQAAWDPLLFPVDSLALVAREPGSAYEIRRNLPLRREDG